MFYLDDGTIGGSEENVLHDFQLIKCEVRLVTSACNSTKGNLSLYVMIQWEVLFSALPQPFAGLTPAWLLAPIGDLSSIDSVIAEKVNFLRIMRSRLNLLHNYDAPLLLTCCSKGRVCP